MPAITIAWTAAAKRAGSALAHAVKFHPPHPLTIPTYVLNCVLFPMVCLSLCRQVMKQSKGRVNPGKMQQLIAQRLAAL